MKQGNIGRIDRIYFIFKEYAESIGVDRAALLEDMYHYARIYSQIDNAQIGSDKLNRKLNSIFYYMVIRYYKKLCIIFTDDDTRTVIFILL